MLNNQLRVKDKESLIHIIRELEEKLAKYENPANEYIITGFAMQVSSNVRLTLNLVKPCRVIVVEE